MFPYDQEPFSGPGNPGNAWGQPLPPVSQVGPLGDQQNQVGQVFQAYRPYRHKPQIESWAEGAAIGFAAWLIWRQMKRRKAAKGEYTSPGWRFIGAFVIPQIVTFVLMMFTQGQPIFLFWAGLGTGAVLATWYAVYRVTAHGRYNTRRQGSPWRSDHRPR